MSLKIKPLPGSEPQEVIERRKKLDKNLWSPFGVISVPCPIGAGKTTLILNLVKFYKKFFDRIVYFSNTLDLDPKVEKFKKKMETYNYDQLEEVLDDIEAEVEIGRENAKIIEEKNRRKKNNYHPVKFSDLMRNYEVEDEEPDPEPPYPPFTMLIVDDASAQSALTRNSKFTRFVFSTRHFRTMIFVVTHQYKQVPKSWRPSILGMALFDVGNDRELQDIIDEFSIKLDKDDFKTMFNMATKKKYSFLNIDKKKTVDEGKYKINFDKIIKPVKRND